MSSEKDTMAEMECPDDSEIEEAEELFLKMRNAIKKTAEAVPPAALQPGAYNSDVVWNKDMVSVGLLQDLVAGIAMWDRLTADLHDLETWLMMRKSLDLMTDATWKWCYKQKGNPEWAALHHLIRTIKQWVHHTEDESFVLTKARR